jgi:8-oxo-dGTP diphosphatase
LGKSDLSQEGKDGKGTRPDLTTRDHGGNQSGNNQGVVQSKMTFYVAGFAFDPDYSHVVLIEKQKPTWQKGKLNGVGGKVEPGETQYEAMSREFLEETGVDWDGEYWDHFATLTGDGFTVYFLSTTITNLRQVQTMTDEQVTVYGVNTLPYLNTIPNLKWLIPMAISMQYESVSGFSVMELREQAA